jgi:Protein of unknown function (DUF4238)
VSPCLSRPARTVSSVNSKQRRRQADRRRAHGGKALRPRQVLERASYSVVKKGHIVPATYQRNFAIDDRVAVHPVSQSGCFPQAPENAGTRSRFYRRRRPDGSEIDDVEASLSAIEDVAGPVLASVPAGASIDEDVKGILAQFFAVQMVRGPLFFSTVHDVASKVVAQRVRQDTVTLELLRRFDGDIAAIRQAALEEFWMKRFEDMLGRAQKASSILGCMRWRSLRLEHPVVAYSDQPVVLWPVRRLVVDDRPKQPTLGPLTALEIRIPISPTQILLMTWDDASDDEMPVAVPTLYAAETNALVIAQADEQWMHRPGEEPPVAGHLLRPISGTLDPSYDHNVVQRSQRRRTAARHFDRVADRQFVNTVQLITSISRGPISRTRAGTARRRRRARR